MDLRAVEFEQAAVTLARRFFRPNPVPGIVGLLREENGKLFMAVRDIHDVHIRVSNVTRIKRDGGRPATTVE